MVYDNAETVQKLWDLGLCISDISKQTGLGHSTIQNYLMGYENYSSNESHRRGEIKARLKANNQESLIFQYDKNGCFIKEWLSTKQIEQETNINSASVGKVLRGIRNSAGGYYWSNQKVDVLENIVPIKSIKKVVQYDLQGNYIATHLNCLEAAKSLDKKDGSFIGKVCKGKRPSAYGYKWKYVEE